MYKNALDQNRKGDINYGDIDKDGDSDVQISNKLRRDAFLVFRALCKLSMKNAAHESQGDPFSIRGKTVALELLKISLENAGTVFRTSDRYYIYSSISCGILNASSLLLFQQTNFENLWVSVAIHDVSILYYTTKSKWCRQLGAQQFPYVH